MLPVIGVCVAGVVVVLGLPVGLLVVHHPRLPMGAVVVGVHSGS